MVIINAVIEEARAVINKTEKWFGNIIDPLSCIKLDYVFVSLGLPAKQ